MCRKWIYLICFALVLGLVGTNEAFGTTLDMRITSGGNDVEQHLHDGQMEIGSGDLELAYESAGTPPTEEQIVGLRFVNIALPKGAQVTIAYVEFEVDETKGGTKPVNLIIEGELTPNASPFRTTANDITNRTSWTTAKVNWSVPNWPAVDVKFQTPDISSIIQEIVNQEGWVSGNALILIFRDDKSNPSTGVRCAEAVEGEATAAPLLHIEAVVKAASAPNPANGATGVEMIPTLSWMPGVTAATHDVYFGTSSPPSFIANQPGTSYAPGPLALGTTYYWRIDEVEADGTTKYTGDIWSFTVGNYSILDDFESYNVVPGPPPVLSDTWSASGSVVSSLEVNIIHGGKQAMRVDYNNTALPYQGQVSRTPSDPNLTTGGTQALSLWFYGDPGNTSEGMYVVVEDAAGVVGVVNHLYLAALTINEWSKWEIPFSAFTGAGVNMTAVKNLSIGVGNRANPTPGGAGVIRIDDIQVSKPRIILEPADVTTPGDTVQGIPSGLPCGGSPTANYSPCTELPPMAIDDNVSTKYLNFGGNFDPGEGPSGFRVAPSVSQTIVTGLTFTTANDAAERDPVAFELYGSNVSIAGLYTLIASGEIVDFKGATAWPRFTKNATPISFVNNVAYDYYQVLFTAIRGPSANSMQIAEVELIGISAP